MTPNIASPIFNVLVVAFFVVTAIGIGVGIYAASALKKAEERR